MFHTKRKIHPRLNIAGAKDSEKSEHDSFYPLRDFVRS